MAGVWPHNRNNREAAEVISYEIVSQLAQAAGIEIVFGCVTDQALPLTPGEAAGKKQLELLGVEFLPVVKYEAIQPARSRLEKMVRAIRKFLLADPAMWIAGYGQHRVLEATLGNRRPFDLVLTLVSESATALAATLPAKRKFAYYGNPDFKPAEAAYWFNWFYSPRTLTGNLRYALHRFAISRFRAAHLKVLRSFDVVSNLAKNDADFYRDCGIRHAPYIRNMWTEPAAAAASPAGQQERPYRIIANVGSLAGTGNTLGMNTVITKILPELRKQFGGEPFELHLFGPRELHPLVSRHLPQPEVVVRGFVEDLDAEIQRAHVFLVANNSTFFRVGCTRFLHAWSLGGCVVAFDASADAMPELEHEKNSLLGKTPEEVAAHVVRACRDAGLRKRLAEAGYETLTTLFNPKVVVSEIEKRVRELISLRR